MEPTKDTEIMSSALCLRLVQTLSMNQQTLSSLIWWVAELPRGDYRQSGYGRVILPFTVLRRLDCMLAPTKAAALKEHADRQADGIAFEAFVNRKTGELGFFNISPLDMGRASTYRR
jgi:type I restriction enzyme M protein